MSSRQRLSSAALMLALCVVSYAQTEKLSLTSAAQPLTTDAQQPSATRTAQDIDELKKQALLVAQIKKLQEENAGLKDERDALKGQVDSALALSKTWKGIASDWQEAATGRKDALGTSTDMTKLCTDQLAKAEKLVAVQEARIYALEHPGLLKELFDPKNIIKIGGGFVLGRVTAPK